MFIEVTGEKLIGRAFLPPPPILNRVKTFPGTKYCQEVSSELMRYELSRLHFK